MAKNDVISMDTLRDFFKKIGEHPVAYQRVYAIISGSIVAGLLWSQMVYWTLSGKGDEFYKTDEDFCTELGMGIHEFRHAKKILETIEIVKVKRKGIPARTYYKLDLGKTLDLVLGFSQNKNKDIPKTNTETNTETIIEGKDITQLPNNSVNFFVNNLGKEKNEAIYTIFEFWNGFKGKKNWYSHRKLTFDIVKAILDNLKEYTIEDICLAIDRYATVLIDDKYFWNYSWPLAIFLTVKYTKRKDSDKKWWQFLPENFIEQRYLNRNNNKKEVAEEINDPDPDLTNMIIQKYGFYIGRKDYEPLPDERVKFVKTTIKMLEFYKDSTCQDKVVWIEEIFHYLNDKYGSKGELISPGHLCSEKAWHNDLSQYLKNSGVT